MTWREQIRLMLGKAHPSDVIELADEILTVGMVRTSRGWAFYSAESQERGIRIVNMPKSLYYAYVDAKDHLVGLTEELDALPYSHRKRKRAVKSINNSTENLPDA